MKKTLICFSLIILSCGSLCLYNNNINHNEKIESFSDNTKLSIEELEKPIVKSSSENEDFTNNTEDYVTIDEIEDNEVTEETDEIVIQKQNIYELKEKELLQKQNEIASIQDKKEWFLAYKDLINEYSEWCDPPESIYDVYSSNDIYLMQRCIETETFEQNFMAKVNVASVILNRLESEVFPDAVNQVIVKGQFAFGRKNISEDTKLALEYAYMIGDTTNNSLYFHSNRKTAKFNGANYIFTDDAGHHFYR